MTIRIDFLAKYIVIISTQVRRLCFTCDPRHPTAGGSTSKLCTQDTSARGGGWMRSCFHKPRHWWLMRLACFVSTWAWVIPITEDLNLMDFYDGSWLFLCICDLWTWKWLALKRLDWRVVLVKIHPPRWLMPWEPCKQEGQMANLTVISWIGYTPTRIWIDIHYH